MGKTLESIGIVAVGSIIIGTIIWLGTITGTSRGTANLYTFRYRGKPAIVQIDNRRLAPDLTHILLDDKYRVLGEMLSDDGKVVSVFNDTYSVRDAEKAQTPQ